jgi:hypothetical protein
MSQVLIMVVVVLLMVKLLLERMMSGSCSIVDANPRVAY